MRVLAIMFFAVAVFNCVGCSIEKPTASQQESKSSSGWSLVAEDTLNPTQQLQQKIAVAAREALFERLMKRLAAVVETEGPAAAIAVCQSEAPTIAQAVGHEKNVRIGRTSDKLRNSKNQPPEWAVSVLKDRPTQAVFLTHPDGRFAALLPVRLKAQCLTCHGPIESIPMDVRQALLQRYPEDRAIGYAEGDLRGWFWVEVPKPPAETGG
jgi:hypothetical protein